MSLAERLHQLRPGEFFLDPLDVSGLQQWLRDQSWIDSGENVVVAERAGEGNMNCTVRVRTNARTFILKQAGHGSRSIRRSRHPTNAHSSRCICTVLANATTVSIICHHYATADTHVMFLKPNQLPDI